MNSLQTFSIRRSKGLFLVGLGIITILTAVLSLGIGSVKVEPQDVLAALLGQDTVSTSARIILYSRLPRMCAALLAGAALAAGKGERRVLFAFANLGRGNLQCQGFLSAALWPLNQKRVMQSVIFNAFTQAAFQAVIAV